MFNPARCLTVSEVWRVVKDLRTRSKRSLSKRLNLIIFRLSAGAGLRRTEIGGLLMSDVVLTGPNPYVLVRRDNTKGQRQKRRQRFVPLNWDKKTLDDITAWFDWRVALGAKPEDPFVCGVSKPTFGKPLGLSQIAKRWRTAIKCLGKARVKQLSIHTGRHTFATIALEVGHSLPEVRDALGHRNLLTTSIYLHAVSRKVPDLYGSQVGAVAKP